MKIGFTSKGNGWESEIDPRFGRAEYLLLYDEEQDRLDAVDNNEVSEKGHGVGPVVAQKFFRLKADVIITGNGPGTNAATIVDKTGMTIYTGAEKMTVREAYENYKTGHLHKFNTQKS
jgi:predicted Fe-Mo cluster-binding NifX family protein